VERGRTLWRVVSWDHGWLVEPHLSYHLSYYHCGEQIRDETGIGAVLLMSYVDWCWF